MKETVITFISDLRACKLMFYHTELNDFSETFIYYKVVHLMKHSRKHLFTIKLLDHTNSKN